MASQKPMIILKSKSELSDEEIDKLSDAEAPEIIDSFRKLKVEED